jgi:hypothetical protein
MRVGIDIDGYRDEYTRLKAVFNFLHMFGVYNTIFEINRVSDGIHLYSYLGNIRIIIMVMVVLLLEHYAVMIGIEYLYKC